MLKKKRKKTLGDKFISYGRASQVVSTHEKFLINGDILSQHVKISREKLFRYTYEYHGVECPKFGRPALSVDILL